MNAVVYPKGTRHVCPHCNAVNVLHKATRQRELVTCEECRAVAMLTDRDVIKTLKG